MFGIIHKIVHGCHDLPVKVSYSLKVMWVETIMVHNSLHLCMCYVSCYGNFTYTCTWATLHCS